ncbi:MAG: hypothetical protein M3O30_16775 [Planctomycetota bacterium]|nr:hypothetical protein [Planctomycetota bacterium]
MRFAPKWILLTLVASGCATNLKSVSDTALPDGVRAAFAAEHPYANINHPSMRTDPNGSATYIVPYTRPDTTEGTAVYTESGVLLDDKKN